MSAPNSSFQLNGESDFACSLNSKLETRNSKLRERGLSLVELILFIVIVGAAVAGIIAMISMTTQSSADPMVRKQALSIAEAMLEEVRLQPFTVCDVDDPSGGVVAIGTIASASANGNNSTLDVTGVNLNGQNAVVVFVGYENDGDETVTSVAIDPGGANVSMTQLASSNNTQSGGDDARIYLYGLANPPQGTFTIRVTFNNPLETGAGSNIVVYPLSSVDTAAPFRTPGTDENDGDGQVTVPSAVGDLVLAGVSGETIDVSTVASPAVEDRDIGAGACSGTDCSNNLATAHRDGAAPNVTFNWSHDDDHWAAAGVSVKPGCAEAIGPETGESRYSTTPFDHVNDYHGFDSNTAVPAGIRSLDGTLMDGLDGYRVTVSVEAQPLGGIGNDATGKPQSLLITVTVTGPGNTTVTVNGYRTRYAPNETP
jgi:MSHA pilin protein MshD